jgi:hypothetical protein
VESGLLLFAAWAALIRSWSVDKVRSAVSMGPVWGCAEKNQDWDSRHVALSAATRTIFQYLSTSPRSMSWETTLLVMVPWIRLRFGVKHRLGEGDVEFFAVQCMALRDYEWPKRYRRVLFGVALGDVNINKRYGQGSNCSL